MPTDNDFAAPTVIMKREYEALKAIADAANTIDADLGGNTDNRTRGSFMLDEEARVRLLLKCLRDYQVVVAASGGRS